MTTADPPRLVLRFAVCTCVALALAAGAILMVVRHLVTVQAEHAPTAQARVIADSTLRGSPAVSDFGGPVAGLRRGPRAPASPPRGPPAPGPRARALSPRAATT